MNSVLSEDDWKNIEESLNLIELSPALIERKLLSLRDPLDITPTQFLRKIRENGKETVLSSCFVVGERNEHLGHEYVACLLHGKRRYAEDKLLRLSSHYEDVFTANMTKVVRLLSVKELLPHLVEKRLLTSDESSSFSTYGTEDVLRLFIILKTKGPTAFSSLVECIGDEKQHVGHKELYSLVTEGNPLPSPKPAKPCELSCGEELTSQEYHDRRHQFEKYYHSGQWDECLKLAKDCMQSSVLEVKVIGLLELALSYVFRVNEVQVVHHVGKAEHLCMKIENSHRTFLSGRCKYLLALLYHYLVEPERAKRYIGEAKEILFSVEVGVVCRLL